MKTKNKTNTNKVQAPNVVEKPVSKGSVETKKITRTIIHTMLTTLGIVLGAGAMFLISIAVVAPSMAVRVYDSLGAKDVSYIVYQRVYEREKTDENLYNVLQASINMKDYENIEKYAVAMLEDSTFQTFSKKIDEATKKKLDKKYSVYADSYESYVRKWLVIALYENGKTDEAKMKAINSVYDSDGGEMYEYVRMLKEDKDILESERVRELRLLRDRYDVWKKLEEKQVELELGAYTDNEKKLVVLEQKIKIAEVQYCLSEATGNEEEAQVSMDNIKAWTSLKEDLLKALG